MTTEESKGYVPPSTLRRIKRDFVDIVKEPLTKDGIFVYFDDKNFMEFYFMIIGPEETPYQGGFYLFKGTFPIYLSTRTN